MKLSNVLNKKIRFKEIFLYLLIIFIMLLEYKWFFLPSNFNSFIIKFNTDDQSSFIVLVILIGLFVLMSIGTINRRKFNFKDYKFCKLVLFMTFLFIIEVFYTILKYPFENYSRMISSNLFYLVVLLYFILKYFFENTKYGYKFFIKLFTIFNLVLCCLFLVTSFIYSKTGEIILNFYSYELVTRNDSLRIYSGCGIITVSYLISIGYKIFTNDQKFNLFHYLNIILSLLTISFVTQTRALILILVIILLISFFLNVLNKKNRAKSIVSLSFVMIVLTFIFLHFELFDRLDFSTNEISYINRIYAYSYFFDVGITNFLGIGLLTDYNPIYAKILHGPKEIAYISDVGIVGMFGKLGIMSIIWYFCLIFKFISLYKKMKGDNARFIVLIFALFLLISPLTQNFVNYLGIIFVPVAMAVSEYLYNRRIKDGKQVFI